MMTDDRGDNPWVRHRMILLCALGVLLLVPWLGLRDLWYPDEPDIGEVCRAMFASSDWIAPRLFGEVWVDYPPALYWVGCLFSYLLGGMSEFTLRLPLALAAIGLALATCATGSRWFGPRNGLWAGLVLLTSWEFVWMAIGLRPDMLFGLFIGLGLFAYARGVDERPRWGPRVGGFALLGLAVLTKGPLGLLLPGLVLVLWHGARREWRRLLELAPLPLITLAVALPWYIACGRAMGVENIWQELYLQNVARFLSGFRGHRRPPYYYLVQIWSDLAPWAVLLPFALGWIVRSRLWRDKYIQLALWWFGAFFVFLSVAVTKRQMYLLPAYPAAALLLARWLSVVGQAETIPEAPDPRPAQVFVAMLDSALVVCAVLAFAAAAAMGPLIGRFRLDPHWGPVLLGLRLPILLLGIICLAIGVWVRPAWRRREVPAALFRLAMGAAVLFLVLLGWCIPTFNPVRTYALQSRWILGQIGPETRIGLVSLQYGNLKRGAFAYYTGIPIDLLENHNDLERFFQEHPHSLVLVEKRVAAEFFSGAGAGWRRRVARELRAGGYDYLVVQSP